MESVPLPMRCGREYLNNRLYNLQKMKAGYYFNVLLFLFHFSIFSKKIRVCHNGHTLIFCICNQLLGRTKYKYVSTHKLWHCHNWHLYYIRFIVVCQDVIKCFVSLHKFNLLFLLFCTYEFYKTFIKLCLIIF